MTHPQHLFRDTNKKIKKTLQVGVISPFCRFQTHSPMDTLVDPTTESQHREWDAFLFAGLAKDGFPFHWTRLGSQTCMAVARSTADGWTGCKNILSVCLSKKKKIKRAHSYTSLASLSLSFSRSLALRACLRAGRERRNSDRVSVSFLV
jgi:hypothetical protein